MYFKQYNFFIVGQYETHNPEKYKLHIEGNEFCRKNLRAVQFIHLEQYNNIFIIRQYETHIPQKYNIVLSLGTCYFEYCSKTMKNWKENLKYEKYEISLPFQRHIISIISRSK